MRKCVSCASLVCLATLCGWPLAAETAPARDAYFRVPIDELKITAGELPKTPPADPVFFRGFNPAREQIQPYVVLDGPGEAYVTSTGAWETSPVAAVQALLFRVPQERDITGTLYVPKPDRDGLSQVKFSVSAAAADPQQRTPFLKGKAEYYERLLRSRIPGGSWFRYQALEVRAALAGKSLPEFDPRTTIARDETTATQLSETFDLFSGGRAVSENLQLDRVLPLAAAEEPTVNVASLAGINVAEMDWTALTKDLKPEADPLAQIIPADQHALLFPTFNALLRLMDEADINGTPVLQAAEPRAESARTRERYEKQLCLETTALARLLGEQVVASVAFTGSDPYLRTGSDVALLFQPRNAAVLKAHLAAQHSLVLRNQPSCQKVAGAVGEVKYMGVLSPDRVVCSYLAEIGQAVVVTNSLAQLQRLADTAAGRSEAIVSQPEYRFFRDRYPQRRDDSALLVITDKTIRRWCGAKWRIAASRRTRAAAVMSHYQAQFLREIVEGTVEPHEIRTQFPIADLGSLRVRQGGITSSIYGTLEFQTPIAELDCTKVTKSEADMYERWRQGYQRNWSQFFDPIAVSFTVREGLLAADMTVMPLIASSDYRKFVEIASGVELKPGTGDPHAGSLLHWALAVNTNSERMRWAGNLLEGPTRVSLLGWLGESISFYADADPFWTDLQAALAAPESFKPGESAALGQFVEQNIHRLPVAFTAEVKDPLKLTLFLSGVRAFIEQTAPRMLEWTSQEHKGLPYVKIRATEAAVGLTPAASKLAIFYAASPRMLVLTLNEDLLKRALDRQAAAKQGADAKAGKAAVADSGEGKPADGRQGTDPAADHPPTWAGKSMALRVDGKVLELLEPIFGRREYQAIMQARAWSNLPILNEWKRLYSERDPLAVHQQVWGTALLCPGGGRYVWNKEFQTMESTVYGHPGQPRTGPALPQALRGVKQADFDVTFENRGLRAKVEVRK
ncbi:MAG: hypothetical protein EXS05_20960 [Planctomycetaceae bacterium]|nr:hypothetical protein [Planctomycetaceae bacterium]